MRVLGSLRAVLGALYTHAGAAVSQEPSGGTKGTRRVSPPHPPLVIPAIAYPDGVLLRARVGAVEADGASQAEPIGAEVFADVGIVTSVGSALASPLSVSQSIIAGEATAVGAVEAKALSIVVYVPVRVRRDAIDKAWTALQNEEDDELLELLGVLE